MRENIVVRMDLRLYVSFVAWCLLGTTYGQELTINPPGEHVKRLGEGAVFACSAPSAEEGTHQWLSKDGTTVVPVLGVDDNAATTQPNVMAVSGTMQLMFNHLKDGDEGEYTCKATINGQPQEKSVTLKIYKPITVVNASATQTPRIYTDALIHCVVTANPTPTVQWFFANQTVIEGPRYVQESNGLLIRNITKADNGGYICMAAIISQGDLQQIPIKVEVTVPPTITVPLSHHNPIVGKPFAMLCQASGEPTPTYLFYKMEGGQKVPLEGPKYMVDKIKGELKMEALTVDDEGIYVCDASNVGGFAKAEVEIDVMVPPKITDVQNTTDHKQGEPGVLTCVATGDPAPKMTWRRFDMQSPYASSGGDVQSAQVEESTVDRGQFKEVTLKLKFMALKPTDTQNYTCEAENIAGNASQNGQVIVQFQPNFDNQEQMFGTTFFGWGGHRSEISCVADAHPMPFFQWIHNGAIINENDTFGMTQEQSVRRIVSKLTIDVKTGMGFLYGSYVCSATNHIGKSNITLQLRKAEPPGQPMVQANEIKPTTIELIISPPAQDGGQDVLEYVIEFNAEGSSETQTQTATKNPDPQEPRTKHVITGLQASKTYAIKVSARNNVGVGTALIFSEKTTDESEPEAVSVTSARQGELGTSYNLEWEKPLTGGRELTRYNIRFRKVSVVNPDANPWEVDPEGVMGNWQEMSPTGEALSQTLTGLNPLTYYLVEIAAVNALGESPKTSIVIRSGSGVGEVKDGGSSSSRCSHSSLLALAFFIACIPPALLW